MFREQIDFIEDLDAGFGETFELAEDFFNLRLLLFTVSGSGVADVKKDFGLLHFFEGGAKAGDERVRQVTDESDRVGEENAAAAGQLDGAEFGIERGEHARRRENMGAGERIEERTLSGIGVADDGDCGHGNRFAALALLAAHAADRFEIDFELVDATLNAAAIGFELGFAGSAGADAAAELRHGFAAAGEAGEHVLELSEFDLELAFARAGVAGEDVEDELRAVEHTAGQSGFEIAQLRGRKVVIEEDEVGLSRGCDPGNLFDFAGANERGGIRLGTALKKFGSHDAAGADKQLAKLCQRLFSIEGGGMNGAAGDGTTIGC